MRGREEEASNDCDTFIERKGRLPARSKMGQRRRRRSLRDSDTPPLPLALVFGAISKTNDRTQRFESSLGSVCWYTFVLRVNLK